MSPKMGLKTLAAGTALTALYATPVWAQEQPAAVAKQEQVRGLEEIVVTARRQSESLIRVPVAVTALSAADLRRNNATDLMKIAEMTPQVVIQRAGSGNGAIFSIRGIGSNYLDAGVDQSVLVNIDNVSVNRGRIATASQFDVGQVEILKGPQALFYGKNAPAGVISISSAAPTDQLSGYMRGGYEFKADQRFIEGAISGPLTDTLKGRFAARYDKMKGWIKNVATGYAVNQFSPGFPVVGPMNKRAPGLRSIAGRGTLEWNPDPDFKARFKLLVADEKGNGEDAYAEVFCSGGRQNPSQLNLLTGQYITDFQTDCKANGVRALGRVPAGLAVNWEDGNGGQSYNTVKSILGSLTLDWQVGDIALTAVTGYTRLKADSAAEGDGLSFANVFFTNLDRTRTWSQEFRAVSDFDGPLNFTFGLFYENSRRTFKNGAFLVNFGPDPTTGRYYGFDVFYLTKGETYSGFGQARWEIVPDLELAGGVRYTREKKDMDGGNLYTHAILGPAFGLAPAGVTVSPKFRDSNWSPEVTLSYHPTRNSTVYAAYKTGYKSGGFSNAATFLTLYAQDPRLISFGAETSKGFEVGVKGELLDRTLRFDLAAYRYTFDGLQLSVFNPTLVAYFIRNAAKARTTGIEGSVNWLATNELTLRAAASYNKAEYVSFPGAACYAGQTVALGCVGAGTAAANQDRSGQLLPRAPKLSFNAGFSYDTALTSDWMIGLTTDAAYSAKYSVIDNGDPRAVQKSFWRLNASIKAYSNDEHFELALVGRNLTNKYYGVTANDLVFGPAEGGVFNGTAGRPREVVLQAQYKF